MRGEEARGGKQRRSNDVKRNLESGNRQVNQVEYDSGEEPFAFPINFNGERACGDVIRVKINNTATSVLVDSGAQSTVLGERQFNNLVRDGLRAKLQPEERNLRVYGNGCFPVMCKFEASVECYGRETMETILSGYQLKLHIDPELKPVTQKPRRIPYPLKDKVFRN